jgi:cystathionine gamma-synthase/methionine-gamma-lyase
LLGSFFSQMGAKTFLLDAAEIGMVESALAETRPAALIAETISNPLLKVADIPTLAKLAHHHGAALIIDNTFASPYLYNPIAAGADYVVHSATKYLGGHGDVMAGVIATSAENRQTLYNLNKLVGGVLGPFEAWLALRGLKTLPLRMQKQCTNALEIARWLEQHPGIEKVNYPGLESHPQHVLAMRMFGEKGYGGVLSFEVKGAGKPGVFRFMEKLRLVQAATTLGDVYTLALHPATASHRSLTPEARDRIGIRDNLVRISAGIEAAEDIIEDLDQALRVS